jgi:hypothetical protein
MLSIWFFIGVLLLIYGVLICGSGIYEALSSTATASAMADASLRWDGVRDLHVAIWWGGMIIVLGAIYTIKFAPGKGK